MKTVQKTHCQGQLLTYFKKNYTTCSLTQGDNYNDSHVDAYAEMFTETNHPGADIQIRDTQTHAVIGEYQLKSVAGAESIHTHFHKYPDIPVYATDEVAQKFSDSQVKSSSFENEVLKARVQDDLDSVADNSLNDRAWDSFLLAAGVASSRELFEMVKGDREFPDAVANACKAAGVSSASTLMARFQHQPKVAFEAAFVNQEIIGWVARNSSKPQRTGQESWTIQANPLWSQEFIEFSKEDVVDQMLGCAKKLGLDCSEAEISVHRWRYASGSTTASLGFYTNPKLQLSLCGDWLNGGRVEGAWLSGYHLANKIANSN